MSTPSTYFIQKSEHEFVVYAQGKPTLLSVIALLVAGIVSVIMLANALMDGSFTFVESWLELATAVMFGVLVLLYFITVKNRTTINKAEKIIITKTHKIIPFSDVMSLHIGFDVKVIKYGSVNYYQLSLVANSDRLLLAESANAEALNSIASELSKIIGVPFKNTP